MKGQLMKNYWFIILVVAMFLLPIFIYYSRTIQPTPTYNEESQTSLLHENREKLLKKVKDRPELTPSDKETRETILQMLPEETKAGILYETTDYRIEYIESLDLFKVEIMTNNINQAKIAGNEWFLQQGMSQQGICDLPLNFYLNYSLLQANPSIRDTFNPLPDNC